MKEPTEKQKLLLEFINNYQIKYKVMPTLVEMSTKLNISVSQAQQRIDALIRKRYLERKNIYIIKKYELPNNN